MRLALIAATAALALGASAANANDLNGVWVHEKGSSKVKFTPCGDAMCGQIVWLKRTDTPAKVGQRIFFDMKANGASTWTGKALNPEDGKTYDGKLVLAGSNLTTSGCVFGGMICKSVTWTKE